MNASVPGGNAPPPTAAKKTLLERLEELLEDDAARGHLTGYDIVIIRLVIECIQAGQIVGGLDLRMLGHLRELGERPLAWKHRKTLGDAYDALEGPIKAK